jgi:hypothetical protein
MLMAAAALAPSAARGSDSILVRGGTQGEPRSRSTAGEFSRWLAGHQDLVLVGEFQAALPETLPYEGTVLVRCRVLRCLRGVAVDSVVTFSRVVDVSFARERMHAGARILAWVARQCTYHRRPCGDFYAMAGGDTLLSDYSSAGTAEALRRDPRPLRFSDLDTVVVSGREIHDAIEGTDAIAVAGLIDPTAGRGPTAGVTFQVVNARWLVPGSAVAPGYVTFPRIEDCSPSAGGRLYLLPVPRGFRSDTLTIDVCARVLSVQDGECLAIGAPVDSLARFVRRTGRGLNLTTGR